MKRTHLLLLFCCVGIANGLACGPWFHETILDDPQAALRALPACYEDEVRRINPASELPQDLRLQWEKYHQSEVRQPIEKTADDTLPLASDLQIEAEIRELKSHWKNLLLTDEKREELAGVYERIRQEMLGATCLDGFILVSTPQPQKKIVPAWLKSLTTEFPSDVRTYLLAAHSFHRGDLRTARQQWLNILKRPLAERRFRSIWAAWMLAKTSATEAEALPWYGQIGDFAEEGCFDVLGLHAAALGWLSSHQTDEVEALRLAYFATVGGRPELLVDVRSHTGRIFHTTDEALFRRAAADRLARELVHAHLAALFDHNSSSPLNDSAFAALDRWLKLLQELKVERVAQADQLAGALYALGKFTEAKQWLAQANPEDVRTLWLQGKFSLREGQPAKAKSYFQQAAERSGINFKRPREGQISEGTHWHESSIYRDYAQNRLFAEYGVVCLSRNEFTKAFQAMAHSGYEEDASYLAERVLSITELKKTLGEMGDISSLFKNSPAPAQVQLRSIPVAQLAKVYLPALPDSLSPFEKYVYLTGRRLARADRWSEARPYFPASLRELFDHYVATQKAAHAWTWHQASLAPLLWRQAVLHRFFGMELFGTEYAPDGTAWGGSFPFNNFAEMRARGELTSGVIVDGELKALPPISSLEVYRLKQNPITPDKRFHYRYEAAELAWQAARKLPNNNLAQAYILNTAGRWLDTRDPQAADRFYKALVRRNRKIPIGQEADRSRWFISIPPPEEFMVSPAPPH